MDELFRVAQTRGQISIDFHDDRIELHIHQDRGRWFWTARDMKAARNLGAGLDATLSEAIHAACQVAGLTSEPAAAVA